MTGCCFFGCKNRTEQGYILKCFPKNQLLRNVWLRNINRTSWTPTTGSRICEVHFDIDQWEKIRVDGKKKLKESAVPTLFGHSPLISTINNSKKDTAISQSPQKDVAIQTDVVPHANEVLRKKNIMLRKLLLKEKQKCSSLRRSLKRIQHMLNNDQIKALSNKNRRFTRCSNETVSKALKIKFACGRNGYETFRRDIKFPLPSIRTLTSRLQNLRFESGILHEVFHFLKIKISDVTDMEKDCMLTLDEMALKSGVDYCNSSNTYVGSVTLPGHEGIASHALVFMLGGISSRWKQVVAYYFTGDSVDGSQIGKIVVEIIKCSASIGLNVNCVTSDMGASNQRMWSSFGIVIGRYSRIVNLIKHPCENNSSLYFMADVPHVFKNIKQCLITNKIIEIPESLMVKYGLPSKIVNVEYIKEFCNEQDNMELKFAPKLNQELLNPSHFDKMKVGNAYKVLHHDVSCGLKFIAEERNDNYAVTTAWFVDFIYKWFKILTSRNSTLALSKFNSQKYQETLNFLSDIIELFMHMKIAPDLNGRSSWKSVQTGVILSTVSIIGLQDLFLNKKNYTFLLTSRFTQDCLENLFSQLRLKQPLPSPLQFKQNLKNLSVMQFLKIKERSSYEEDDRKQLSGFLDFISKRNIEKTSGPSTLPLGWNNSKQELTYREKNILYNCTGYIIRSIAKQIHCDKCLYAMGSKKTKFREYSKLVNLKEYSTDCLYYANRKTFKLCILIEQTFTNLKNATDLKAYGNTDLIKLLKTVIENEPLVVSTPFPSCHKIKNKLVDRFIRYRLRLHSVRMKYKINEKKRIRHESKSLAMRDMASQYNPKR